MGVDDVAGLLELQGGVDVVEGQGQGLRGDGGGEMGTGGAVGRGKGIER